VEETEKIWMNGELVDWADAKVHVGVHGPALRLGRLRWGFAATTRQGPGGLPARRSTCSALHNSARLLHMQIPYSVDELKDATNELLGANGLDECYIRPIASTVTASWAFHAPQ